jgi:thioredoxin-like negative regulator of GroEL
MESLLAHFARKERQRLRIARVDVDVHPDVAEKFRVALVPTLVLVRRKRAVARLEGRVSAPKIQAMLEPHLEPSPSLGEPVRATRPAAASA